MTGYWRSVYALTHDVLDVLIGGDPVQLEDFESRDQAMREDGE